MRGRANTTLVWVLALMLAGCGDLRPAELSLPPRFTFVDDIQPLLARRCMPCHAAQGASGLYPLVDWRSVFGPGTDLRRNLIAGRSDSTLITALGSPTHATVLSSQERRMLRMWTVDDRAAYFRSSYHPRNWLYPEDRDALDFHGGALRAARWNANTCRKCHGADLAGGRTEKSCLSCHPKGPFSSCDTCHGGGGRDDGLPLPDLSWSLDPARSSGLGAHRAHALTTITRPIRCQECHLVPQGVDSPGHLFDDEARTRSDRKAEVVFGRRARMKGVNPRYDQQSLRGGCRVYCHGAARADRPKEPSWRGRQRARCDFCHPVPMKKRGGADCTHCHQQDVKRCKPSPGDRSCYPTSPTIAVALIDPARHMDGKTPLGRKGVEGTCWACHGSAATKGAPGPDLDGRTDVGVKSVGMHAVHLRGGPLRVPLTCDICHRVPDRIDAFGHIDSERPAEVIFNDLASGKLREPSKQVRAFYDPQTGTCNNVYCHSRRDGTVGAVWSWTQKLPGGIVCNSCHKGHPDYPVLYCKVCHPKAFKETIDPTTHMNGRLDFVTKP